jgi:hypothetical protein
MHWKEQFETLWTKKLGYKDAALKDKIDFQRFIEVTQLDEANNADWQHKP